jgi:hypothetical protein
MAVFDPSEPFLLVLGNDRKGAKPEAAERRGEVPLSAENGHRLKRETSA